MSHKKREDNDVIPAVIKNIPTSKGAVQNILFSVSDVIGNKKLLIIKTDIMREYQELIKNIKILLGKDRPSSTPRKNIWEAGNLIVKTRERIRNKYGVDMTNIVEAVAVNIGLSKRFIQYMVQFSKIIPKEKVIEEISWSNYKEALDLINKKDFEKCVLLIKNRKLRNREEIRKYVRRKNQEWKTKRTKKMLRN